VTCEPLDVVAVPFPFTDRPAAKRRPALVVSSAVFNQAHAQSILAMITSARSGWQSDVALQEWRKAGLQVPCKVRLKLFTLDDALILRRLGRLSKRDGKAVRTALARSLVFDSKSAAAG
jgi:mRNA interferase MazF